MHKARSQVGWLSLCAAAWCVSAPASARAQAAPAEVGRIPPASGAPSSADQAAPAARAPAAAAAAWLPVGEIDVAAASIIIGLADGSLQAARLRLRAPGLLIEADRLEADRATRRVRLYGARLRLDPPNVEVHGTARVATGAETDLTIEGAEFSRCPPESAAWSVTLAEGCLEPGGDLVIRDALFRIGGHAVLPLPWMWIRFGRFPGLLPPALGSREGRGPFLRVGAFLPAGVVGDFEIASTAFPLDGVDVTASWLHGPNRLDVAFAGLGARSRTLVAADVAAELPARGAFILRGMAVDEGARPSAVVGFEGGEPGISGLRYPSVRGDAFVLLGAPGWSAAGGGGMWQDVTEGSADAAWIAAPRVRMEIAPGIWDDRIRFPGFLALTWWRSPDDFAKTMAGRTAGGTGIGIGNGNGDGALAAAWKQAVDVALPMPAGFALRPFAAAAGRREAVAPDPGYDGVANSVWAAAGIETSIALERRWIAGAYHRTAALVRYARVLHASGDPGSSDGLDGPDLLRVAFPQTVRAGALGAAGSLWAEWRSLDRRDPSSMRFGFELVAFGPDLALDARVAVDGDGDAEAVLAGVGVPGVGPADFAFRYAYRRDRSAAATAFLPWEDRPAYVPGGRSVALHGLDAGVTMRLLDRRFVLGAGAEIDVAGGGPASLRFSVGWDDPAACLVVTLAATAWLDERIPSIGLAVRL